MDAHDLSLAEIQTRWPNFSVQADEHFWRCWSIQSCGGCLDASKCSWCPFSSTCVPNSHAIPALAPAHRERLCPELDERWEVRTRPFGCHASTITTLTAIVSVLSTLALVALGFGVFVGVRRLRRFNKRHPTWWPRFRRRWQRKLLFQDPEQEPLLPGSWVDEPRGN